MPAQNFRGSANGVAVTVKAPEGALPENSAMTVKAVSAAQVIDAVEEAVAGEAVNVKALDISFTDADGKEIEPAKKLKVTLAASAIAAAEGVEGQDVALVHIDDSGAANMVNQKPSATNAVTFNSADFSVYAIVIVEDTEEEAVVVDDQGTISYRTTYKFFLTDQNGTTSEYTVNGSPATQVVKTGDTLIEPEAPAVGKNQEFTGWYVKGTSEKLKFGKVDTIARNSEVEVVGDIDTVYYITLKNGKAENATEWPTLTTLKAKAGKGQSSALATISSVSASSVNDDEMFLGWTRDPAATEVEFTTNQNVELNADITLYPVFGKAHWLYFDENDGGTGGGASYTPPQYVLYGTAPEKPADPERPGYRFEGWYTQPEGGQAYVFDQNTRLESATTVYAHWSASAATYTVVFWQQKVTDDKNAPDGQKTYDYKESSQRSSYTDQVVSLTSADIAKGYTGFHYNSASSTQSATVKANGSTVLNVYYDRDLVTMNFTGIGEKSYTYTSTTDEGEGLYGYVNGDYQPLKAIAKSTTGFTVKSTGEVYTGQRYTRSGSRNNYTYTPTDSESGTLYGYVYTSGFFYGSWQYQELKRTTVTTYEYTLADGTPYTGTRFAQGATTLKLTIMGLYGQPLSKYGYTWPEGTWKYSTGANSSSGMTYLGQFILPDGSTYGTNSSTNITFDPSTAVKGTINFYLQDKDGSYPERPSDNGYSANETGTFTFTEKYNGFSVVAYQNNNASGTSGTWTAIKAGDSKSYTSPFGIRYARNSYSVDFRNGSAGSVGTASRLYEASLAGVDQGIVVPSYPGNKSESSQYTFLGWFADPECTTYVSFGNPISDERKAELSSDWGVSSFTTYENMPASNLVVYAGWSKKWFNVTLDANGGTLPKGASDNFWVQYGDKVASSSLMQTTRKGYTLIGWCVDSAKGTPWNFETGVSDTLHLVAKWASEDDVSVRYDAGEGQDAPLDDGTYTDGAKVVVKAAPTPPEGKVFVGWRLYDANGKLDGTYYPGDTFEIDSSCIVAGSGEAYVPLVAAYVSFDVTTEINYNANGGSGRIAAQALPVNTTALLSTGEALSRDGYTLVGWSLTPGDQNQVAFKLGGPIAADKVGEENNVLYAVWAKNVHIEAKGAKGATFEYDGTPKTNDEPSVSFTVAGKKVGALPEGLSFSLTGEARATQAGTYEDVLSLVMDDYDTNRYFVTTSVNNGSMKITKPQVDIVVRGAKASAVYDGNAHAVEGYSIEASNPAFNVVADLAFTGQAAAERTDAGTTPMGLEKGQFSLVNANFELGNLRIVDGSVTVEPLHVDVTVTGNSARAVYSGKAVRAEGYQITHVSDALYQPEFVEFVKGEGKDEAVAERTDAGSTPMGLSADNFKNTNDNFDVAFSVTDGGVDVDPLPVTVTVTGNSDAVSYSGREQSVTGYTAQASSDLFDVEADLDFEGQAIASGTQARDEAYPMGLKAEQFTSANPNFQLSVTVKDGFLSISPADSVKVSIVGATKTAPYNGAEQSVSGYTVLISNDAFKESDIAFSGTSEATRTDVGSAQMGLKADQFSNTNANFKDVVFEIVQDGTLEITPAPVSVTVTGAAKTVAYNRAEQQVEGYTFEVADPTGTYGEADFGLAEGVAATAAGTVAGTYAMGLKAESFKNKNKNFDVSFAVIDGELVIAKAKAAVRIVGATEGPVAYDRNEHVAQGYTVEVDGDAFKADEDLQAYVSTDEARVAKVDAGTYAMGLAASDFANANPSIDVSFTIVDGRLEITPIEDEVVVSIRGAIVKTNYNGLEQVACGFAATSNNELYRVADVMPLVEGEEAADDAPLAGEADFAFGGTAAVKAIAAGSYAMGLDPSQFQNLNRNFSKVTFRVADGSLDIDKLPVTVEIAGKKASSTYNGALQSVQGFEVTGISEALYTENDFTFSGAAQASGTDAGTYAMGLTPQKFVNNDPDNFAVTFVVADGELVITPVEETVTVSVEGQSLKTTYDGSLHAVNGYKVTNISNALYSEEGIDFTGEAKATGTDAGSYAMQLSAEQFANIDPNFANVVFDVTDGVLDIGQLPVTVRVEGRSAEYTYDGAEHEIEGFASVTASSDLYVPGEESMSFGGSAEASLTDVGEAQMGLDAAQFENLDPNFEVSFEVVDGVLSIKPLAVSVSVEGAIETATYDGHEHVADGYQAQATSELFDVEKDLSFSGTAHAALTDAGTSFMGLEAGQFGCNNPNFQVSVAIARDGQVTVTAADEVMVTIVGAHETCVYDGEEHVVRGYTVQTSNELYTEADFSFDEKAGEPVGARIEAGTSYQGLSAGQFANTNANFGKVTFQVIDGYVTVEPLPVTVTVRGSTATTPYDGLPHSASGYAIESISSDLYRADYVQGPAANEPVAARTEAGTTPLGLSAAQFANTNANFDVSFAVTDGFVEVTPIAVVVSVVGKQVTKPFAAQDYTARGFEATADVNAGQDGQAGALFDVESVTYSGVARAMRGVAGKTMMDLDPALFSASQNANFSSVTFVVEDGFVEVTPIPVTVTVRGAKSSADYNAEEHAAEGFEATADVNEGRAADTKPIFDLGNIAFDGEARAVRTDAGTTWMGLAPEQFSSLDTDNFSSVTFVVEDGSVTVNPIPVTVTVTGATASTPYDGQAHAVQGYQAYASTPLYKVDGEEIDFGFGGQDQAVRTQVGTTQMGLAPEQFFNVNANFGPVEFKVADGFQTVVPCEVNVIIEGNSRATTYNGYEQSVEGYVARADNALYDTSNDLGFSGSARAAGTKARAKAYTMGLSEAQFANLNPNFTVKLSVQDGSLVIRPLGRVVVSIRGAEETGVYSGEPFTASGYTVQVSDPLYTEDDFAFAGSAEVSRTMAGSADMGLTPSDFNNLNENFEDVEFVIVRDGRVTVNQASAVVTVEGPHEQATYDGKAHTVSGFSVTSDNPLYAADFAQGASADFAFDGAGAIAQVDAGVYAQGLSAGNFSNLNPNFHNVEFRVVDGQLTIDRAPVKVVVAGKRACKEYNGTEQQVQGYSLEFEDQTGLYGEADVSFAGEAVACGVDASDEPYLMGLAADQFANVNPNFEASFTVQDGSLSITPLAERVYVSVKGATATRTYDGGVQTASGYTVTNVSSTLYDVEDFSFGGAALAQATDAADEPYAMGLAPEQFQNLNANFADVAFVVTDGWLKVNPRPVTVNVQGAVQAAVYDGIEHEASGFAVFAASDPLYDPQVFTQVTGTTSVARTDAGTTNMGLTAESFTNANANFAVSYTISDGYVSVSKLPVQVNVAGRHDAVTFDGQQYEVSGYDVSATSSLFQADRDLVFAGEARAQRTQAGTVAMGLDESQFSCANPNFDMQLSVTDGFLAIAPVDEVVVTITGAVRSSVYDGLAHEARGFDVQTSNPLYSTADFSGPSPDQAIASCVDVGSTAMGLSADQFKNENKNFKKVRFQVVDGYQEIVALPVSVSIVGAQATARYDAQEHAVSGYEVSGISSNLYSIASIQGPAPDEVVAARTDAGTTVQGLSAESFVNTDPNFDVSFQVVDGSQTVEPIDVIVKIRGARHVGAFDATEHRVRGYILATDANDDVPTGGVPVFDLDSVQHSGTAEATRTLAGKTYMGLAPGQFWVPDNPNYRSVSFDVTDGYVEVTPIPVVVSITGATDTAAYDGTSHEASGYTASADVNEGLKEGATPVFDLGNIAFDGNASAVRTDVGTTPMGLDPEQFSSLDTDNFSCVTFVVKDGYQKVTPIQATVYVKGADETATYDGKTHVASGYTAQATTPLYKVEGADASFACAGQALAARADAGTTAMGLDAAQFSNVDPNFDVVDFVVEDGSVTVTPLRVSVDVTGHSDAVTFNGREQAVVGYDLTASDPLYDTANVTFRGSAEARGTRASATPYAMGLKPEQFGNADDNFQVSFQISDGFLAISPVDEVTVLVRGTAQTGVYSGVEQAAEGYEITASNPLYGEADFAFSGTARAARTDAGTTPMGLAAEQFSNTNEDYARVNFVIVEDGSMRIDPAPVTVNIKGVQEQVVYDRTEHAVEGFEATIDDSTQRYSEQAFALRPNLQAKAVGTNAGTYAMGIPAGFFGPDDPDSPFVNADANFAVSFAVEDGWLQVAPIQDEIVVSVTGAVDEADYSGQVNSISGYTVSSSDERYLVEPSENAVPDYAFAGRDVVAGVDAGYYPMGLKTSDFQNVNENFSKVRFAVEDGGLTVKPVSATVTITGHADERTYSGEVQQVEGYDVETSTTLYTENDFIYSGQPLASGKNASDEPYAMGLAPWRFANVNPNFENVNFVVAADGQLKVNPRQVTVSVQGATEQAVFDGAEHVAEGFVRMAADDALYDVDRSVTCQIAPKAVRTDAGTSYMGLTAASFVNTDSNFDASFAVTDGWAKVDPAPVLVSVTGNRVTATYDGEEHVADGYTVRASNELFDANTAVVFAGKAHAARTDAGTTSMGLDAAQFSCADRNFDARFAVDEDGSVTIAPAGEVVVTITGARDVAVYDGVEHAVRGYTVQATDELYTAADFEFVPGKGVKVEAGEVRVARTNAGTTPMGLDASQFANVNPNFDKVTFVVYDGGQVVEPAPVVVSVRGAAASALYDTAQHEVYGYRIVGVSNDLYDTASVRGPERDATRTARTDAGTTPMGLDASQFANADENFDASFAVEDGWVTVEPIDVVVRVQGATAKDDYDADEHAVEGYELSCDANDDAQVLDLDTVVFAGSARAARTDAGTSFMGLEKSQFSVPANANYRSVSFEVEDGYQRVNPITATVIVRGERATADYDGQPHVSSGYSAEASTPAFDLGTIRFAGDASAARTDAGTTPMGLEAGQFSCADTVNFSTVTFRVKDGYQRVKPISAVVTVRGAQTSAVFDAAEHVAEGYTAQASTPLYRVGGDQADFAYAGTPRVARIDAGTTPMGLDKDRFYNVNPNFENVEFQVEDGGVDVARLPVTVHVVGRSDSVTYNGREQVVEGFDLSASSALYNTASVAFGGEAVARGTDAAAEPYRMGLTPDQFRNRDANFDVTFDVADGLLAIARKGSVRVIVTGNAASGVFDGSPLVAEGFTFECNDPLYTAADFELDGDARAERADAGTGYMGLDPAGFRNVNPNFENVEFVVVRDGFVEVAGATAVVNIVGATERVVYDGQAHEARGYAAYTSTPLYVVNATGDEQPYFTYDGAGSVKAVDAGSYAMGLDAADFGNANPNFASVEFRVVDGLLAIDKAVAHVTISGHSQTVEYDGKEHEAEGYDASADNPLYDVAKVTDSGTAFARGIDAAPKPYAMGLSAAQFGNADSNFDVSFDVADGGLTITPVAEPVVVSVAGRTASRTYDGAAHAVTGYDVTSISNPLYDARSVAFQGVAVARGTDAAAESYAMGLTPEQFANRDANFGQVRFDVADGWLAISPLPVTVTVRGKTAEATYDGAPHRVIGFALLEADSPLFDPARDLQLEGSVTAERTDAGTTPMGLDETRFTNTNPNFNTTFDVEDGSVTITKRSVVLTSADASKPFDGTALVSHEVAVGGDGFAAGEVPAYLFTGSQTEVGSSQNLFSCVPDERLDNNYDIQMVYGTLEVTEAPAKPVKPEPEPGQGPSNDGLHALSVDYVYSSTGKPAAPSYEDRYAEGQNFRVESPSIEGFVPTYTRVTGVMPAGDLRLTVSYAAVPAAPVQAQPTGAPAASSGPAPTQADEGRSTLITTVERTANVTVNDNGEPVIETIDEGANPLGASGEGSWSLFDLVATVLVVLVGIVLAVGLFGRKRREAEEEREESGGNAAERVAESELQVEEEQQPEDEPDEIVKRRRPLRIGAVVLAVAAVILLLVTQDFSQPMALFDGWSLAFAIGAVVQVVLAVLARKRKKDEEEETENDVLAEAV